MWELDCEEGSALKNWCFWTVVLEKIESPLDCKEIQPVHSKGDQSWVFIGRNDAKAETPVLWPLHAKSWLIGKDSDGGRGWGQEEKWTTEDKMAGWHHWLDGREFEWTPGVGDGQRGLACCDSWGRKDSDMTERLNWTELNWCRQSNHMWITAVIFLDNLRFFFPSYLLVGTLIWCCLRDIFEHFIKPLALSLCYCIFKKHIVLFSAPLFIISFFLVSLGIFYFCISTFIVGCLAYTYQKYSKAPLHIHHIFKKADRNVGKHVKYSSRNVHWYNHLGNQIEV